MKKLLAFGMGTLLLLSSLIALNGKAEQPSTPPSISPDQYQQAYRYNVQGWIYLHIQGEPYERGYQHGYLLVAEIVDMLNRWSNSIHNYPKLQRFSARLTEERYQEVSALWWGFCVDHCTQMYWDKFPEEYQQEIKGIADGVTARGGTIHGRNVTANDILTLNEMYEFMSKLTRIPKAVHPLRTFFHQLQKIVPETASIGVNSFLDGFLSQEPAHHCNGFIATGNATTHGQLVVAQSTICGGGMWWWTYYISLRWNVMLDLQPSKGYRIMMPTSPGYIWSDEDYYQNDAGIVLLETTIPQGMFDNKGLPLSVRVRTAMQYGSSINDVVYNLRNRNDGSMDAVWLVGDTKTGEIARFELGYKAFDIWRTSNGFFWSANNPYDIRLRIEKFKPELYIKTFLYRFVKIPGFCFHTIRYKPETRDVKYNELGKKYYGMLDVDRVKEISFTPPISAWITDCKISDTDLVKNQGIWAYFGNPWKTLNITSFDTKNTTIQSVQPCGWVQMFGVPSKENFTLQRQKYDLNITTQVLWKYNTNQNRNDFSSAGVIKNDILYETTSSGFLYAMNAKEGTIRWSKNVGKNLTIPVVNDNMIFVGHSQGLSAYTLNGDLAWNHDGNAKSSPVLNNSTVLFWDTTGVITAVSASNGKTVWTMNFSNETYLAAPSSDILYLTSGKQCFALDLHTRQILWTFDTQGMITTPPVLAGTTVYVTSWDTYLYALDADTGALKWLYETGFGFNAKPVISQTYVFLAGIDNNLYAFDEESGVLIWVFSCNAAIHSQPVVYGEYIFFGSDDGHVYAVNWTTGLPAWSFAPDISIENNSKYNYLTTPLISDVTLWNKTVNIGAKGFIFALDAQTMEPTPDSGTDGSSNDTDIPDDNETDNHQDNQNDTNGENNTNNTPENQSEEPTSSVPYLLIAAGGGGAVILLMIVYVLVRKRKHLEEEAH